MRVTLTGASGFIGSRLVKRLSAEGHELTRVDIRQSPALGESDAVIHLAGEPVAQRWTAAAKQRILESRRGGTRRLVEAMAKLPRKPDVLVSASAIGIYGSRGDEVLTEQSAAGTGFLPDVAEVWEREARAAEAAGVRVVIPRIGVVLGDGGALKKMLPAFRLGAGGRLGPGTQWMSWIQVDDLVELIVFALGCSELSGPVNATAPNPVTNAEFTRVLAGVLRRPAIFPVPALALKVLFGEMSSVLLDSTRVAPRAAEAAGFRFRYPELKPALSEVLKAG